MKKLAVLREEHPAADGEITVVREAQQPNAKEARCRHCPYTVPAGTGHVIGHGDTAEAEHYRQCPTEAPENGEECAVCGVPVVSWQATRYYRRDGSRIQEIRHRPRDGRTCLENPVPSPEEQHAALAERDAAERECIAAERAEREKAEAGKARRAEAREAKKEAEHAAEQAHIAGLETVSRSSDTLFGKNLGDGRRASLIEHTDTLSDGSTTRKWEANTYLSGSGWNGEDYDPDPGTTQECSRKEKALRAYRGLKYQSAPLPRTYGGGTCDNRDGPGARYPRHDSSGIKGKVCGSCNTDEDYMLSFA
jgi:hypothetical protein